MKQAVLVGMPNCGKSSLFQRLTGKHVKTGNRAGVTVEALSARVRGCDWTLTDLPGIRSADPVSEDEIVTADFLRRNAPDLVIAVLDATAFSDQYPLLSDLHRRFFPSRPVLWVLNFCDELESIPSVQALESFRPLAVLCVSARTGAGVDRLRAVFGSDVLLPVPFLAPPAFRERLEICIGPPSHEKVGNTLRWDRLLLHPALGFPAFFLLMSGILFLTFGPPGEFLTDRFCALCLSPLRRLADSLLPDACWWAALLRDGVLGGVGAIAGFFPRLLLLFLLQTFLEQSGYLARASRLFDPFMRRLGLRGDAITPLLLGFGCSVPAILCTRGMKDADARRRCTCFLPVVACSARIPLCLLISDTYFPGAGWLLCALLWVLSGVLFLFFCALTARWERCPVPDCHTDPLPRLRMPSLPSMLGAVREQFLHFLSRAGGIIFLTSVGVWLLSHFRPGMAGMVPVEESALAALGGLLAPLLKPLGLNDWRIASALLSGIGAKEATLSTLGVLLGAGTAQTDLSAVLLASGILNRRSALSLLFFYLFYFPCAATLTVQSRPRRLLLPLAFAYLLAMILYQI